MTDILLRLLAESDLVGRSRYLARMGGASLAERFFESAIESLNAVSAAPAMGSPTLAEVVGIPGLRRFPVDGFSCSWFYIDRNDVIDVIRLLADRQDVETLLGPVRS